MKAVRTAVRTEVVEAIYSGDKKPSYKVGDYMRVYCGSDQDHCFTIKDVRFNLDTSSFEYLKTSFLGSSWKPEGHIVPGSSRLGWHYDSRGYCDNPGRGY